MAPLQSTLGHIQAKLVVGRRTQDGGGRDRNSGEVRLGRATALPSRHAVLRQAPESGGWPGLVAVGVLAHCAGRFIAGEGLAQQHVMERIGGPQAHGGVHR